MPHIFYEMNFKMTNLIKNKKLTRITALLLAIAVIFGTMFTLPVSAASGDKVTITFDYCYDSAGNIIRYKQTTVSDGSTVWKNLGSAKQKEINLAMLYGKPGSGKNLSGTEAQKWIATQLSVWEFVSGCRSTADG